MAMKLNPLTGQMEDDSAPMPTSNDLVKEYFKKTYNLDMGDFSNESRQKLVDDSKIGFGDKAGAALAAIGAGFMGKDAAAAGQSKLNAAKAEKQGKLDAFDKGRANFLEERKIGRQAELDSREDEKYAKDQELLARERDPNSQESQMANELAKRMGYKGAPVTAEQFKQFSPALSKMYDIEQKKLDREAQRADRALQREIALGQKNQAREDKLEKEAKLSDKQIEALSSYDKALNSISSIRGQKGQFDTGPLAGRMNSVAGVVGMDDAKKSAFRAEVQDQLAQYIKSISGGAVSDSERAALMQNLPNMNDNDETFNKKLDALEKRLAGHRQTDLDNYRKGGKNVKEFDTAPKATGKVRVSNGKETLEIDASDLADAEKDGYKRI